MSTVFFLSATVCCEGKKPIIHFKMALRTICAFALRNGTDLGVNNARTFVTTGTTFLSNYYIFKMWKSSFCICMSSMDLHL